MLKKRDQIYIEKLVNNYEKNRVGKKFNYPLLDKGYSKQDIVEGLKVLLSRNITMSMITQKFEKEFGKFIGSKYALMVNSGSSANLLVAFALTNPKKKNRLKPGDQFLIPALCWSTSLWPMVQAGLKPKFIDVSLKNFCLDTNLFYKKKEFEKIKAIMSINILGNSPNIKMLEDFAKKKNLYLIEDTCEALGSKYGSKFLGTFGDFGTFSFYYSHQITSGEGGMVVCKNKADYELIHTLRAHGWDRGLKNVKSNSFNFVNSGFNLRPMDITAAIGLSQFRRLNKMMKIRKKNRNKIINFLKSSEYWKDQFTFFEAEKNLNPSWFGFPVLINHPYLKNKKKFIRYLNLKGIETRPILSGNFLNQPASKLFNFKNALSFKNAQEIEERGFFIGLPTEIMDNNTLNNLVKNLLKIHKIND